MTTLTKALNAIKGLGPDAVVVGEGGVKQWVKSTKDGRADTLSDVLNKIKTTRLSEGGAKTNDKFGPGMQGLKARQDALTQFKHELATKQTVRINGQTWEKMQDGTYQKIT